jgi:CMP-N,N'-diacetyllegionaminic acid synthase
VIAGLSVLAIVPARGGSKGIPRKNIRPLAGLPLIGWTLRAARASRYIDRLILSSEDEEIIRIAQELGCEIPFRRPRELAQDSTPGIDPVLHAITSLPGYDIVVLLQPTSPLRLEADIDACIERMINSGSPVCVSVREAVDHPYWCYASAADGKLRPFVTLPEGAFARRQDLPRAFTPNGAVYVAKTDWLVNSRSFMTEQTIGLEMPEARSLDIDTEEDLAVAESRLRHV